MRLKMSAKNNIAASAWKTSMKFSFKTPKMILNGCAPTVKAFASVVDAPAKSN